ncbi:MAG: DUF2802 domain-containing protein [Steroidobacteraceae bacterium]
MFETISFEALSFEGVSMEAVLIFARGVFLIAACGVLALAIVRWRKQIELDANRVFEQLDITLCELRGVQEQVQRLDARLDAIAGQVEAGSRYSPQPTGAAARGYDLAVRLAKRGAPADELIGSCGITRHEAELLVRLHSVRVVNDSEIARRDNNQNTDRKPAAPTPINAPSSAQASEQRGPVRKRGSLLAVG